MHAPTQNLLVAMPAAAGITAALLLLMTALLRGAPVPPGPTAVTGVVGFVEMVKRPPVETQRLIKPEPFEAPPAPPAAVNVVGPTPALVAVAPMAPGPTAMSGLLGGVPGAARAESPLENAAPILLRQAPASYPASAQRAGRSGYAIVRFDVTPAGTVANVSVVEASHAEFGMAAVRAAARLRYRPRQVDGAAVTSVGHELRYRFDWETP